MSWGSGLHELKRNWGGLLGSGPPPPTEESQLGTKLEEEMCRAAGCCLVSPGEKLPENEAHMKKSKTGRPEDTRRGHRRQNVSL